MGGAALLMYAVTAHAETIQLNPLKPEISSIPGFFSAVYRLLVMISLPLISLAIVYSGFLFVVARGNQDELARAKRNFFYVIIGSIAILSIGVITTMLYETGKALLSF